MKLAQAFEVFDEVLRAGLEGSIHAHRLGHGAPDFTVTLTLVDRAPEQLATLAAIDERYDLSSTSDDPRFASLT